MRTLGRPPSNLDLSPSPRIDGSLPGWSRQRIAVQNFVTWALANQQQQCAFCGYFVGDVAHRRAWAVDHFAPKGTTLYPQWTFEPLNLIVTCHSCNSVFKKGFNTVVTAGVSYADTKFRLVHPYLDDIDDHVTGTYQGGHNRVGAPLAHSLEGKATVEVFHLDDVNYLSAINGQALRISIDQWKGRLPGARLALFKNLVAEVTGR